MTNLKPKKSNSNSLIVAAVSIAASICFGVSGIYTESGKNEHDILNALFNSLKVFALDDNYDALVPNGRLNWQLLASRWLGAAVSFSAIYQIIIKLFSEQIAQLNARKFKGHITIIGKNTFSEELVNFAKSNSKFNGNILFLGQHINAAENSNNFVGLPFDGFSDELTIAGINNASKVIIDAENDAQAIQLALNAQKLFPNSDIIARVDDIWLARNLQSFPNGRKLRAFSIPEAASREIVRRHFPFLIAEDLGQARIKCLLIGDFDWLEAIIIEIILSCRTIRFGEPSFVIMAQNAIDFQSRIKTRYPEIEKEAQFEFIELCAVCDIERSISNLTNPVAMKEFTAAYCAFADETESLTGALNLKNLVTSVGGFAAPIFVRLAQGDGMILDKAGKKLEPNEIVPFGTLNNVLRAADIISGHADLAEKEWHKIYLKTANPTKPASKPWEELDEEYRISNRRAVAHVFAKLFEAGINIRPFMESGKYWDELPKLGVGEVLFHNEEERQKLAELEHLRWNADRRMQGWIYGEVRNDARKIHDNLCDYSKLSAEIQGYDLAFIDDLAKRVG